MVGIKAFRNLFPSSTYLGSMGSGEPPPSVDESAADAVRLLFRREAFLTRLTEAPAEKPELIDDLDVSRSTVDRAVKELRTEGLVERRDAGFTLTHYGEISLRCYKQFVRGVRTVRRSRASLEQLPPSIDIPPAFFRDGMVLSAREEDDREPGEFLHVLFEEADELWTVTDSPHFEFVSLVHRRVVTEGLRFNLIHSIDMVERLKLHYPDRLESTLRSGNLDLYASDAVPPFGLIKAPGEEDTVVLILYGEKGEIETVVVTETCAASARFDEVFRALRRESSTVELDEDGNPTTT